MVLGGYADADETGRRPCRDRAVPGRRSARPGSPTGLPDWPAPTQYHQLEAAIIAAQLARDTRTATEASPSAGHQAARLGGDATHPGDTPSAAPPASSRPQHEAHLARLNATGTTADGLLDAVVDLRRQADGEQHPVPASLIRSACITSLTGTAPKSRRTGPSIFRIRDTWLRRTGDSDLPAGATRLRGVLERLERQPDRDHLAYQRATWNEAVSAALDAMSGPPAARPPTRSCPDS